MAVDFLISSKRLILIPIKDEHAELVFKYRSDSVVNQYQGWIPKTINEVFDFIVTKVSSEINVPDTWFQIVLIRKDTHELIGDIGIHFLKQQPGSVELGCTLDKENQGKGFAAEAICTTIDFLILELKKELFVANIDPENKRSIRLFERLGFRNEVSAVKYEGFKKDWPNDLNYVIQRNEWEKLHLQHLSSGSS
jgi:RimJ/RimL family protein N-acetyltransferase